MACKRSGVRIPVPPLSFFGDFFSGFFGGVWHTMHAIERTWRGMFLRHECHTAPWPWFSTRPDLTVIYTLERAVGTRFIASSAFMPLHTSLCAFMPHNNSLCAQMSQHILPRVFIQSSRQDMSFRGGLTLHIPFYVYKPKYIQIRIFAADTGNSSVTRNVFTAFMPHYISWCAFMSHHVSPWAFIPHLNPNVKDWLWCTPVCVLIASEIAWFDRNIAVAIWNLDWRPAHHAQIVLWTIEWPSECYRLTSDFLTQ